MRKELQYTVDWTLVCYAICAGDGIIFNINASLLPSLSLSPFKPLAAT